MIPHCEIRQGDCLKLLREMPSESIDAGVTDPPYEYGFMGKSWDSTGIAFSVELWIEYLRVLKPGAHLLAFAGTRLSHRMICAIDDAGFEIRDQIGWIYGSGFPKSKNLSGAWEGWGTALKPAWEPICVARKPFKTSVAENVALHGTGALNIEASRVAHGEILRVGTGATFDKMHHYEGRKGESSANKSYGKNGSTNFAPTPGPRGGDAKGRWPANIIHDGSAEVMECFPDAPGQQCSVGPEHGTRPTVVCYGDYGARHDFQPRLDSGSAARFFYCAKASRKERDEGCDDLPDSRAGMVSETSGQHITRRDGGEPKTCKNNHPTVKPVALMRYLCRLVTPSGGMILDAFCGSGTTGRAAMLEGFSSILIDADPHSIEIARRRTNVTPGLLL